MENDVMLTWIIPVYNGEKYLAQAIDSILRQPCGDLEILVIDDGSKDGSLKIAQGYDDPRVRAIHKENGGVSSARNLGIENAKSRYIAFLDADDVVCKDAYDEEVHGLLEQEQYDLLSFTYYCGDEKLRWGSRFKLAYTGTMHSSPDMINPYKHFCSTVYGKKLFDDNNIRFPEGIKVGEDAAFQFLIYSFADLVFYQDRAWFLYRSNRTSVLHRLRNHEHMILHSIPAWYWCGKRCKSKMAKQWCDAWTFSEISQYIERCSGEGVPLSRIQNALNQPFVHEILENYDHLWNSSKRIYEEFMSNPQKYWIKKRPKGMIRNFAAIVVRFPFFRTIYMRAKHKESLGQMV